jgi:hypothetical protein
MAGVAVSVVGLVELVAVVVGWWEEGLRRRFGKISALSTSETTSR